MQPLHLITMEAAHLPQSCSDGACQSCVTDDRRGPLTVAHGISSTIPMNTLLSSAVNDSPDNAIQVIEEHNEAIHGRPSFLCHRRHKRRSLASLAEVFIMAFTLMAVLPPTPSEAFSSTSLSTLTRPTVTQLQSSVHKRSGNHDVVSNANNIEQHQLQRKQSLLEVQMAKAHPKKRRSKNVFEQFTPEYMTNPLDVDVLPKYPHSNGKVNGHRDNGTAVKTEQHQKHLSQRLHSLLQNDEGEQDYFADESPEAAEQVADMRIYRKLSEEAKRKATEAVKEVKRKAKKKGKKNSDDQDGVQEVLPAATLEKKRRSTVRATVKETGSDSMNTYIKSLGQHELLNKADEVLLARQVRILMELESTRKGLEEEQLSPPTFGQWATASNHTVPSLKQQIRRSQRAKAALIEANLRLVITVARQAVKKSSATIQFQDACQQGIIGLTRATEKFDPELGFRFSTYAIWWIQKEVSKNVSEQTRTVRVPQSAIKKINDIRIQERVLMSTLGRRPTDEEVAQKVGMTVEKLNFYRRSAEEVKSLDKKIDARTGKGSAVTGGDDSGQTMETFVRDTDHPSPSELIDQQMMKEDIRRLVKTLSPKEQAVIRLRFGLDDGKPLTLTDIAEKFGAEKQFVQKIEARALIKLRQPSRSHVVKCYVSEHT